MTRETKKPVNMSSELSTSKTIVILAVVVGCFAVLWPKVFYPMLASSVRSSQDVHQQLARPERPAHLHPDSMHPALREKGRPIPHRTIEKQARPGPMPGIRPPMGGGGHMSPPPTKGSGAMGILMPIYTVGIIVFFVYTIMKVLFKRNSDDEDKTPKLKDFHLDPEYRKYVFDEEYLDNSSTSHRDIRRQERENSKYTRRQDTAFHDTKLEDEQMDQLRRRLEETETAMERLMSQMGSVTDKLTAAKITEVLTQAQAQARILKNEEDISEFGALTISDDFSLPLNLQRRLKELNIKDIYTKGTFVSLNDDTYQSENNVLINKEIIDLENCIGDMKIMSDNLACNENIISKVMVNDDCENLFSPNKEIITINKPLANVDQFSTEGPSDIAQRDSAENVSDDEDHSGASETGADISELKTFADEGVIILEEEFLPVIVDIVPEVKYVAPPTEDTIHPENKVEVLSNLRSISPSAIEQGTQTDSTKKMSVIDLQTTYTLKDEAMQEANIDNGSISSIKEIILDATLPAYTQLLIKDSHFSPMSSENLLGTELSESELSTYVVTSQVNLAFVGLEQTDSMENAKFIIPEKRQSPLPTTNILSAKNEGPYSLLNDMNVDQSRKLSKSSEKDYIKEISLAKQTSDNGISNSVERRPLQISPDESFTDTFQNNAIEAIAKQIVKEATEESCKMLSRVIHSDHLLIDSSGYLSTIGDNKKSDAERMSSSKASTVDLEDYEILPKSDEISGEKVEFLRDEEYDQHEMDTDSKSS